MTRTLLLFIIGFLFAGSLVKAQPGQKVNTDLLPKVTVPESQLIKINSSITGKKYDIFINIPRHYNDTSKTFPVVYLVDGQWDFPLIHCYYGQLNYDGFLPDIIIVGITWGGENPNYDSLRASDLTPAHNSEIPQSGNAAKFLECIKKEIIPMVESNYRTEKNNRTLMGSSFGGLFTLYALFTETNLFNKYVLTSPAIGWDNGSINKDEENYASKNSKMPVKLFMAIGEYEDVLNFNNFAGKIRNRKYEGLELQTKVVEGMGHSAAKADGFSRGLKAVFAKPELTLAPEILAQYAGDYQMEYGYKITLTVNKNQLKIINTDGSMMTLYAETEKDFYKKGFYSAFHFQKNNSGKVTSCLLDEFAMKLYLKKSEK